MDPGSLLLFCSGEGLLPLSRALLLLVPYSCRRPSAGLSRVDRRGAGAGAAAVVRDVPAGALMLSTEPPADAHSMPAREAAYSEGVLVSQFRCQSLHNKWEQAGGRGACALRCCGTSECTCVSMPHLRSCCWCRMAACVHSCTEQRQGNTHGILPCLAGHCDTGCTSVRHLEVPTSKKPSTLFPAGCPAAVVLGGQPVNAARCPGWPQGACVAAAMA